MFCLQRLLFSGEKELICLSKNTFGTSIRKERLWFCFVSARACPNSNFQMAYFLNIRCKERYQKSHMQISIVTCARESSKSGWRNENRIPFAFQSCNFSASLFCLLSPHLRGPPVAGGQPNPKMLQRYSRIFIVYVSLFQTKQIMHIIWIVQFECM